MAVGAAADESGRAAGAPARAATAAGSAPLSVARTSSDAAWLERLPTVLFEIGKVVGSAGDPSHLLARIAELVCQLVGAGACSIMLLDGARERMFPKAAFGLRAERLDALSFAVGEGVAGWVVQHGEAALIADAHDDPRFLTLPAVAPRDDRDVDAAVAPSRSQIRSMLCVPLTARGEVIGAMTATSDVPGAFTPTHQALLQFVSTTIALDLQNVRLMRVAVTDPLTGVFNRRFMNEQLPIEIERARATGEPLAICMLDLDRFKAVNDTYGHAAGDAVLAEVARRLRNALRGGDKVVRFGGEEFVLILPRADAERAIEIAERVRERVRAAPVQLADGGALLITTSVGVAPLDGATSDGAPGERVARLLLQRADQALAAAKDGGRDRVVLAD